MTSESMPVERLRNIGPTIARRLKEIGIHTSADLRTVGAVSAYQRICAMNPGTTIPVCYYLYSLDGALRDKHWDELGSKIKQELLSRVAPNQNAHGSRQRAKRPAQRGARSTRPRAPSGRRR